MDRKLLQKVNEKVEVFLADPDLPPQDLIRKRWVWNWSFFTAFCIFGMTLLSWWFEIEVLVLYGLTLLLFYAFFLPLMGRVRNFETLTFGLLIAIILTTFIVMLVLGGLTNSMGLIFVGLSCAMSSVLCDRTKWVVALFILYGTTILLAAFLQPFLQPHPDVTQSLNLLYFVLNSLWIAGSALFFILYYIHQRSRFEAAEASRLKELDEAKTRFYTNITHEFRTPLTIILGMADEMVADPERWLQEGAQKIKNNAYKLLRLVNQMLDLAKMETGDLPVKLTSGDVIIFTKYLVDSFQAQAKNRQILLSFFSPKACFKMDFDEEKLESIISNLISNALKYSSPGGEVLVMADEFHASKTKEKKGRLFRVDLSRFPGITHHLKRAATAGGKQERWLLIRIKDSGIGIGPEDLPHVFERFFQARGRGTFDNSGNMEGTGVGLALTKELVELLGGVIDLSSRPDEGTEVIVLLPVTQTMAQEASQWQAPERGRPFSGFTLSESGPDNRQQLPLLLIVEDNPDLVTYLKGVLGKDFHVEIGRNGREGLEKAIRLVPDIILSDVMMPVMDGFSLLKRLKEDIRTSHIPVILLTAKVDKGSKLEGLERGADAYLTKPFNKKELFLRLENMIHLRKQIQQQCREVYAGSAVPEDDRLHPEAAFLKKVKIVLKDHLSDPDFGVEELSRAMNMSRSQLYRKFSALTDQPVGKFQRTLRLRKAKTLLETTGLNVSEVAQEVGFRNLSHFSQSFTLEFGINPSRIGS